MQKTTRLKKPQVPEQEDWIVFDKIHNRPKYAGEEMTSETNIPSVSAETEARQAADQEIWTEIETIEASSDVVDVVGTYAELEAYDTSKLHDKDLIKVLADETHDGAITYYRYSTTSENFAYVGAEGPYYTASETDALLSDKQDTIIAGANISIAADNKTISATDTTYTHFTGATASTDGVQGLVPGPLAGDEGKFLQGDGTWGTPTDTTYTAGTNVQISNQNVISATDTTYTAGTNVQISSGNVISATDTTYSNFTGTDGTAVGTAGLVPAPATTDAGKFLKADGTWTTVPAGTTYTAGTNINISQQNVISATDTTYSTFTGTDGLSAGSDGLVPGPETYEADMYLKSDGTWSSISLKEIFEVSASPFTTTSVSLSNHSQTWQDVADAVGGGYPVYLMRTVSANEADFYAVVAADFNYGTSEWSFTVVNGTKMATIVGTYNSYSGTSSYLAVPKLYSTNGYNTDGAVTQSYFTQVVGDIETTLQILNHGAGV